MPSSAVQPSNHQGHLQSKVLDRGDDAASDNPQHAGTTEDVDEDALDVGIFEDDAERRRDLLFVGAATNVKKFAGSPPLSLMTSMVASRPTPLTSATGTVRLDVEVRLQRRISVSSSSERSRNSSQEAACRKLAFSSTTGVQRNNAVILRSDERVDLHHGTIVLNKTGVQRPKGASEAFAAAPESEGIGEVARLETEQARAGSTWILWMSSGWPQPRPRCPCRLLWTP